MLAVLLMTKGQWKECAAAVLATTTSNGKHHAAYMKMTYSLPHAFLTSANGSTEEVMWIAPKGDGLIHTVETGSTPISR